MEQPELIAHKPLEKPVKITEHQWPKNVKPIVTIRCVTFNHVNFIRDAVEGFLMQETTFPVQILIYDDASTDGTSDVVREYEQQYPQLIHAIIPSENQYSKGIKNGVFFAPLIKGEFVAICEGDDYWITKDKLQKQISILIGDRSLSLVFHNAWVKHGNCLADYFINRGIQKHRFTIEDIILNDWFIATASIVYRASHHDLNPCMSFTLGGDMVRQMTSGLHGDLQYLDEVASVYRRHEGGVSNEFWKVGEFHHRKLLPNHVWTYLIFNSVVAQGKYDRIVESRIASLLSRISRFHLMSCIDNQFLKIAEIQERVLDDVKKSLPKQQISEDLKCNEWDRIERIVNKNIHIWHEHHLANAAILLASQRKFRRMFVLIILSMLRFKLGLRGLASITFISLSHIFRKLAMRISRTFLNCTV
jgi:glycosyltransferase involved in cell wall biosynthesis